MTPEDRLMRRLRWAAGFLVSGILVQGATLLWSHPAAFMFFALIGGGLEVIGFGIYLLAILHPGPWEFLRRFRGRTPSDPASSSRDVPRTRS